MSEFNPKTFMQGVADKKPPCTEVEPELFFPKYNDGGEFSEARAKAVCRACPLIADCLEFALHTGDRWAILGGTTPSDREVIRKRRDGYRYAA